VLKANCEKEVEKLKTMIPDDEQSSSRDATVVDTGVLFCLLLTHFFEHLRERDRCTRTNFQ